MIYYFHKPVTFVFVIIEKDNEEDTCSTTDSLESTGIYCTIAEKNLGNPQRKSFKSHSLIVIMYIVHVLLLLWCCSL